MTEKQRVYFQKILAKNRTLSEKQKRQFTKVVEAAPKSKLFCIDYVKKLNEMTAISKAASVASARISLKRGCSDPITKFCVDFITSIYGVEV